MTNTSISGTTLTSISEMEVFFELPIKRRADKAGEQRMGFVGPGFQLRMGLGGDEPRVVRQFDHFHDPPVGGQAGEHHAVGGQCLAVVVVHLIAVAVALGDLLFPVEGIGLGMLVQHAGVGAQPQGAANVFNAVLLGHQVDDRVRGVRIQLDAVGVGEAQHIAGEFHDGQLQAEAQAKERDAVLAGVADCVNLAVDAAVAETAGNQNAADIAEDFIDILRSDLLGVDPFDMDSRMMCHAAVL